MARRTEETEDPLALSRERTNLEARRVNIPKEIERIDYTDLWTKK